MPTGTDAMFVRVCLFLMSAGLRLILWGQRIDPRNAHKEH